MVRSEPHTILSVALKRGVGVPGTVSLSSRHVTSVPSGLTVAGRTASMSAHAASKQISHLHNYIHMCNTQCK